MVHRLFCKVLTVLHTLVQAYVAESDPIQYEDEVVDDIVQSQLWLLPCLDDLVTIGSQLVKKIRQCAQDPERLSNEASELIFEIKSVMYNVVMMAIARSSWLISWTVSSPSPKLHPLKDQGSASLLLVLNYNKGGLSLRCSATSPKEVTQTHNSCNKQGTLCRTCNLTERLCTRLIVCEMESTKFME